MKHKPLVFGVILSAMVTSATTPLGAQTVAKGFYYPTPSWNQTLSSSLRFIVLSNMGSKAVLDLETGLVWERSPGSTRNNWVSAQFHCNDLNLGNRKGWRLPTLQELASLVDPSVVPPGPTLPSGHPFTNVQSSEFYWTATLDYASPITGDLAAAGAWGVSFNDGGVTMDNLVNSRLRWCVRGRQGTDHQ